MSRIWLASQVYKINDCYAEYNLLVRAPIEVYNALPMPLGVMLSSSNPDRSSLPSSVLVQPLQSCMLHQAGAFHELGTVQLEPMGYANSPAMGVPQGAPTHNGCVHCNCLLLLCIVPLLVPLLAHY